MDFSNIFLVADADGTLLTDRRRINFKDIAAIREFTNGGGMFTIATGRGVSLAKVVADELELQIPAIIFNGAAIYDYKVNRFLWRSSLPDAARDYIALFMQRFPSLGIEILRNDEVYVIRTNPLEEEHISLGNKSPVRCDFDDVPPDNWIKVLVIGEPDVIDEAIEFAKAQHFQNVHMVRSAPIFYEILPSGIDKGAGLIKLLDILNENKRFTVAAGDFMNDLEMIQIADLGVAVENAEEIVKQAADVIVCDNNSGAMWEIIEYLKRMD
jgi:hypothetical protein